MGARMVVTKEKSIERVIFVLSNEEYLELEEEKENDVSKARRRKDMTMAIVMMIVQLASSGGRRNDVFNCVGERSSIGRRKEMLVSGPRDSASVSLSLSS
jgi:hypothetical protein